MEPRAIILRNFVWCDEYEESSFVGRLHEYCEWNFDEYWLLEWALYQLAEARTNNSDLCWPIFKIFSNTFLTINVHFDPNDGFNIANIDCSEAYDLRERFQLVFEGYFSGNMPNQKRCFEIQNPLFPSNG